MLLKRGFHCWLLSPLAGPLKERQGMKEARRSTHWSTARGAARVLTYPDSSSCTPPSQKVETAKARCHWTDVPEEPRSAPSAGSNLASVCRENALGYSKMPLPFCGQVSCRRLSMKRATHE